jgi:muramoyltetrapeptide carboxypeptidase
VTEDVLRPAKLAEGDAVALVSPAGPVPAERIEAAVEVLTGWGLRPVIFPNAAGKHRYFSGEDAARLGDLRSAFADPSMRAVWCLRGGYGIQRIVDQLDYEVIEADPKLVVGFSDITALHLALWRRIRLVTVHGPVAAQFDLGADSLTARTARQAVMSAEPIVVPADPAEDTATVRVPGAASGRLIGGNLALLAATLGTPDQPDLTGAILLLEDVGEAPYRVDRMLTHLLRAGLLTGLSGIAVGQFANCPDAPEVLADRLSDLGVPVLGGLPIGHGQQQYSVPLGTWSTLDAVSGSLTVEAATR